MDKICNLSFVLTDAAYHTGENILQDLGGITPIRHGLACAEAYDVTYIRIRATLPPTNAKDITYHTLDDTNAENRTVEPSHDAIVESHLYPKFQ